MTTATKDTPAQIAVSDKPIAKFNHRGVHVSLWANAATRKDGAAKTRYNTQVESRYRDSENHWKSGHSFDEDQLAVLSDLLSEARRAIRQARQQDKADADNG